MIPSRPVPSVSVPSRLRAPSRRVSVPSPPGGTKNGRTPCKGGMGEDLCYSMELSWYTMELNKCPMDTKLV